MPEQPDPETVGGRIRQIRTHRELTLEELAEKAGISKSFLWEVEQNRSDISGEKLLRVANVLGASLDFLLRGEPAADAYKPASVEIPAELDALANELGLTYRQTVAVLEVDRSVKARRKDTREAQTKEYWRRLYDSIRPFLEDQR